LTSRLASDDQAPVRAPDAVHRADDVLRIGRHDDNDIVLPDLRASDFHAEVRRVGDTYQVRELGGAIGLHLNGERVKSAQLADGDRLSVGRHDFVFDDGRVHEYVDRGPASLFADDLTVQVGSQTLLDDVTFAVAQGSLVGVVGPSGCGKSTLLKAVTGLRPANAGKVSYDGRSLYDEYAELRYRIGMVPQDDVLHRQLSVRRALRFAAALRFSHDVPRRDRNARVDEVVAMLGLTERVGQRIDTLSGGQRKRTSVALELLTEPSLLCLDEPTSGLDPALDRDVMRELRRLADHGRTVMVVTHSVLHLSMCDRVLVMCKGGRMGFFGPPAEVLEFFGAEEYADVFQMIASDAPAWAMRYRNSDAYRKHVGDVVLQLTPSVPRRIPAQTAPEAPAAPAQAIPEAPAAPAQAIPEAPSAPRAPTVLGGQSAAVAAPPRTTGPASSRVPVRVRVGGKRATAEFRQFLTLSARMIAVVCSDRGYAAFLFGLPLILALLMHGVPGSHGLATDPLSMEPQRLLVVLIVGAAFMGIALAIREIVTEGPIYARERAVGVSAGAYLASKLVVFAIIDALQVFLFVWLGLLGRGGPTQTLIFHWWPLLEVMIPVTLVAFTSTVLGLTVSALVKTVEQTTAVLVVSVMAQLVASAGLFQVHGQAVLEQVAWFLPSRWGFAAASSTVNLPTMVPASVSDPLWAHTASAWWRSIAFLLLQAAVLAVAARLALRRYEPGRKN
jgi:ABC-type multidrug transport system ATPase subunit